MVKSLSILFTLYIEEEGDGIKSHSYIEDDAVQFVKDCNSGIPKDLMSLDEINDFYTGKGLETLRYYRETIFSPVYPPQTKFFSFNLSRVGINAYLRYYFGSCRLCLKNPTQHNIFADSQ